MITNGEIYDHYLEIFLYRHELKSLVKEKTCFKSISNPNCIDLFLTVLKTSIVKNKPREIQYRNYKYFDSSKFIRDLKEVFSREYVDSFSKFDDIFLKVLNRHAPLKRKCLGLIMHRMCLKR